MDRALGQRSRSFDNLPRNVTPGTSENLGSSRSKVPTVVTLCDEASTFKAHCRGHRDVHLSRDFAQRRGSCNALIKAHREGALC